MKREKWLVLFFFVLGELGFLLKPEDLDAMAEPVYPSQVEGAWEYPVRPGTQDWVDLESTEARREACQVPQEALEGMDTAALLETALDYPFCADMLAFDREEDGYSHQLNHNGALAALETRGDRHEVMQACLKDMKNWRDEVGQARSAESALQYDCLTIFIQCME